MFNYSIVYENKYGEYIYSIKTNRKIGEARYGHDDEITDPDHSIILSRLNIYPDLSRIDEYLSIFEADEPTYIDLG